MLHATLHIDTLGIGLRTLPVRHATLTVVARAESPTLDWEVVAHTIEREPVAFAPHRLQLTCITGANEDGTLTLGQYDGEAILVRAVEEVVVFRGVGPLGGFDVASLNG